MRPRHPFPPPAAAATRVLSRGVLPVQARAGPAGSAQHPPPPAPEASGAAEAAPGANGQGGFRTTEPEQNPQEQQKSFPRASSARVRRLHEESCWPLRHFLGETPSPFLSSKPRCLQVTPRSLPPDHRRSRRGHLQSDHRRAGLVLALLVAPTVQWSERTVTPSPPEERSRIPLQLPPPAACRPGTTGPRTAFAASVAA